MTYYFLRRPLSPPLLSEQVCCVSRYLESCTGPALKRKSESHSMATSSSSSTSEDDKPAGAADPAQADGTNPV